MTSTYGFLARVSGETNANATKVICCEVNLAECGLKSPDEHHVIDASRWLHSYVNCLFRPISLVNYLFRPYFSLRDIVF
jgi:hypothetical protein